MRHNLVEDGPQLDTRLSLGDGFISQSLPEAPGRVVEVAVAPDGCCRLSRKAGCAEGLVESSPVVVFSEPQQGPTASASNT